MSTQLCPLCHLPLRCDFVVCPHIGATSCAPCQHDTRTKHTCVCEEPEFIAYINKQNDEILEMETLMSKFTYYKGPYRYEI